ncbi:MAG: hypothetical protein AAF066_17630 [Pseudomonadota bacterium]
MQNLHNIPTYRQLQVALLRRRHGLSEPAARAVASLHYGGAANG